MVYSYSELRKPCTLPSHFRFSASPRDTSWRPHRSKARTQRQSKIIQDPFGSYFGSVPQWFHNGSMFCFSKKLEGVFLIVCIMCRFPTRVHCASVQSRHIRPCEAAPGTRWPRNFSEQRQLMSTVATRCISLFVFDNSFLNFINSCLKHFETS